MKRQLLIALCVLATTAVANAQKTRITFATDKHDFGSVTEQTIVVESFEFTNTGTAPLVLSSVKSNCMCVVATWPKEPIAPGAKGTIIVQFNTTGKPGHQSKNVIITANTIPPKSKIEITGDVAAAKEESGDS